MFCIWNKIWNNITLFFWSIHCYKVIAVFKSIPITILIEDGKELYQDATRCYFALVELMYHRLKVLLGNNLAVIAVGKR